MRKILMMAAVAALAFTSCTPDPVACIDLTSPTETVGLSFTMKSCSENVEKYKWNFGKNTGLSFFGLGTPNSSELENPVVTYEQVGNYEVKLVVTGEDGETRDEAIVALEIIDECQECADQYNTYDVCASNSTTYADYEESIADYKASGYTCTAK